MKLVLLFLGAFLALNAYCRVVISDFDDTIKMSNVGNKIALVWNGVFGRKTFAGMSSVFKEFRANGDQIYILTASPRSVRKSVVRTLELNEIEFDDVFFKESMWGESIVDYKMRRLKEVIGNTSEEVILIGDDVDSDYKIFAEMKRIFPKKISAAYIHVVKNREIPRGLIPYFTAFDLAVRENLRASVSIQEELQSEKDLRFIFPGYATCPKEPGAWSWLQETNFAESSKPLISLLTEYCSRR